MSETNPNPVSPNGTPFYMKGLKVAGIGLGVLAVGGIGYWLAVSREEGPRRARPERETYSQNTQRFPVTEAVAAARPNVATGTAPPEERRQEAPREVRVRPSSFGFDPIIAPRPQPAKAQGNGQPGQPQTIAGMQILQAEGLTGTQYMLMPGTEIACANVQPMHNKAGVAFSAKIPEEVRGADGTFVVIPKDSTAIGRVMKAVEQGETRLTSVLTHIIGPKAPYSNAPQLVVPLGGMQMGDELGGAGLPGNMNNRWGERFATVAAYAALDITTRVGSGLLMGQIDDAINGGTDSSGGNVNINLGRLNNGGMSRSLAGRAFDNEINKPPEFNRPQAFPCSIFIQQPIDFTRYYRGR